jgi:hypothetical protein
VVQPAPTGGHGGADRHHHHVGALQLGELARRPDLHLGEQRDRVGDVPGLPLGSRHVAVVEHDHVARAQQDQRVGDGGADVTGADDGNLAHRREYEARASLP